MGLNEKAWGIGFKRMIGDASLGATYGICVDETNRQIHICDIGDADTDWARSASSHPELCIHSASTPESYYIKMYHDGTDANIDAVGATALNLLIAGTSTFEFTTAAFNIGSSGSEITYTEGTPAFTLYATCASTSGSTSAEPFYLKSIMTGAGGVGGRARFHLYTNVALGSWSNALKAYAEYGANGKTTGMGSALCAEIQLSAGTTSGTYAPLEVELNAASGASTGTATGFIYCNAGGTGKDTVIDASAYLFVLGAELDAASGRFINTDITTHTAYAGIPIYIDGVGKRYLAVVSA